MHLPFQVGISPTLKIRGIIATETIKPGQIIEKCPILIYDNSNRKHVKHTVIEKYYFIWTKTKDAIILGYGSLFNHSFQPNAKFIYDYRNKKVVIKAIKYINPGEEITFNYNMDPNCLEPLDPDHLDFNQHEYI